MDTNILVYLYDTSAPVKRAQARLTLRGLAEAGFGAVSTQVLSEFFYIATRRLRPSLTTEVAIAELEHHARVWKVLDVTAPVIVDGARAVRDHQLNFWDTQLWAIARFHEVDVIFSEDFNSGSILGGVHFVDPFEPGFRVQEWLA